MNEDTFDSSDYVSATKPQPGFVNGSQSERDTITGWLRANETELLDLHPCEIADAIERCEHLKDDDRTSPARPPHEPSEPGCRSQHSAEDGERLPEAHPNGGDNAAEQERDKILLWLRNERDRLTEHATHSWRHSPDTADYDLGIAHGMERAREGVQYGEYSAAAKDRTTTTTNAFTPMGPGQDCRVFTVRRLGDVSGTSGTGDVAAGVIFPDGTTVVQWQTKVHSVEIFSSWVEALYLHGHNDQTGFVFDGDPAGIYFSDGSRVALPGHDGE